MSRLRSVDGCFEVVNDEGEVVGEYEADEEDEAREHAALVDSAHPSLTP